MARYLLLICSLLLTATVVFGQTSLSGKVTDADSGEAILFGSVAIYKNGVLVTGTETDLDGNYNFSNIDPGNYDVEVSYVGYQSQKVTGVQVFAGKANKLDIELGGSGGIVLDEVVVVEYKVPLIEQDNTTSGAVITSDQIKNLPTRNINALAATSAGLATADEGDAVTVRGSRSNATDYYVDGIRVQGNLIPESEIDQLQVITGGIEAQYGDVTGGVISITTKGPSNKFSGGIEAESSNFLDPFNQNLVGFNLSGPILKKSSGESILGFRLSGRYTYQEDDDPTAVDVYRVSDEKLAELEANPVINIGGNPFVAADFLMDDGSVETLDAQPFEEYTRYDLTAKIDARLSEAIDITFTGAFSMEEDRFTPGEANRTGANWRLLNSHNNPIDFDRTFRGNFRFRHRLGGSSFAQDGEGDNAKKASVIQNASYVLQAGYEKKLYDRFDHNIWQNAGGQIPFMENLTGDQVNYFDYGYVGNFDIDWIPTFQPTFNPETYMVDLVHTDYLQVLRGYTPGTVNPVLANYNNAMENITPGETINGQLGDFFVSGVSDIDNLISRASFFAPNGRITDVFTDSWNFHTNVGSVSNLVRKENDDIYTFNANTSFDLVPGGSDQGRHTIQLGIMYEQRTTRRYDVNPRNLWDIARQQANNHIQGLPTDPAERDTIGTIDIEGFPGTALVDLVIVESADNQFYRRVRDVTGQSLKEFVNVDGLSPEQLSLDMFSARELNDQSLLSYWGYDYLGNPFDGTFDDFFTTTDANGIRTFPVAPNRPIYQAAYIQDKFTFKDIIFRLGVRVDRYDANTKVLKDEYSLYEIQGASDYHGNNPDQARPGNIGDDFKVYLDESGASVQAYRDADQWYFANGTPANNPALIFPGGLVFPAYQDDRVVGNEQFIKSRDFDPNVSFQDYEVQTNVMPRLAFSFPISTEANFFAHYDILVQRPPSNTIATARDYFYFTDNNNIKNNPDLLPERTIDYEVGFQQKLSNTSALKISAYYKEMRDMIQLRTFFPVPIVNQYTTYDNQDFGTVKGFTFLYDLRRTGNISFTANYTLQFADGTGSDADSQRGLTSRGNLRTLFPLNFDERHRINAVLDFRYGSGKRYNGPRWFGSDIFANAGINLQAVAVSGRPYTANLTPFELTGAGTVGAINGARKPWNFTLNLRVDKRFDIGNNLGLNVYLRVSNVLDQRNIINVYPASGSAEDDGFLASPRGFDAIQSIQNSLRDVDAYLASYQWRIINPNFFSLPRRMYIGAIFDF